MLNTICDDEENQVLQSPVSVTHSTNEAMGGVRPVKLNDYWSNAVPNIIAGFVSCQKQYEVMNEQILHNFKNKIKNKNYSTSPMIKIYILKNDEVSRW